MPDGKVISAFFEQADSWSYSSYTGTATRYFYGVFTIFPDFPYFDPILADHSTCDLYVS